MFHKNHKKLIYISIYERLYLEGGMKLKPRLGN